MGTDSLPPVQRDRSFYGMTLTQFLGAFNDNLFKQLVLLLCLDYKDKHDGMDLQAVAQGVFSLPFVLLSGLAGWLSDRKEKRTIVFACKVAEILIAAFAMSAFLVGQSHLGWLLFLLMIAVGSLGVHSAFFGPSKYGILPELFRQKDLLRVNAAVQMTTFVAIIFGTALAGYSKDLFRDRLWIISLMGMGIAILGAATSLLIRRTPIAQPDLEFSVDALAIDKTTRGLLKQDRGLLRVLLVSSVFWFIGGVVQPSVNAFGKLQLFASADYSETRDTRTSVMMACMGVGIALGCTLAGLLAGKRGIAPRLVKYGSWGVTVSLAATAFCGAADLSVEIREWLCRLTLMLVGLFAGLFIVPLQVFLQSKPPANLKGRMIGAMNFVNWSAIVGSAVFYQAAVLIMKGAEIENEWIFLAVALVMLPVALMFKLSDPET